jgi:hypothetical protein
VTSQVSLSESSRNAGQCIPYTDFDAHNAAFRKSPRAGLASTILAAGAACHAHNAIAGPRDAMTRSGTSLSQIVSANVTGQALTAGGSTRAGTFTP